MNFGPRKLLFSQIISSHSTANRVLLPKDFVANCSCYILCPDDCNNTSSEDERYSLYPPPPPPSSQKNNMPTILILMLCVLGAAFACLCYLTILKRYRSNLNNSRRRVLSFGDVNYGGNFVDENHGPVVDHPIWYIRTVGLQQSVIDSIPVFKYKKLDGLVEGKTECSVCLSEFEEDESLRLLPKCTHAFHIPCIDTWLRSHKNCPLCRAPVVLDTAPASTGQSGSDSVTEDATVNDDHRETMNGGNGEVLRGGELRIEGENIGRFRDEQGKILGRSNRIRVMSDLSDSHRVRIGEDQLQLTVRRSFSMDMASASRLYAEVANKIEPLKEEGSSSRSNHLEEEVEVKKQNNSDVDVVNHDSKFGNIKDSASESMNRSSSSRKSFSFGRSLQSVPIRMKRSFSSSAGKSTSHSNSKSQELDQTV